MATHHDKQTEAPRHTPKRPRGKALGMASLARELGISRQRIWQLMQKKAGLCRICGRPSVTVNFCEKHRNNDLEQKRRSRKARRAA